MLVPEPRIRTRSSPASGPGSPGSKPGSRPSASWSRGAFRPPDAESPGGGSADPASASARRVAPRNGSPPPAGGSRQPGRRPPPGRAPRWPARRPSGSRSAARGGRSSAGTAPSRAIASAWSGASLASLTRQRPSQLLDDQHRVEQERHLLGAQLLREGQGAQRPPCTRPRCWSGAPAPRRRWRSAGRPAARRRQRRRRSGPRRTDAGPGLPRAAPSVRTMSRRGPAPLRPCAPRSPARPRGWPA